ncbi:chorismate mutase [Collinsella sp. AGMB00827]|uniref:Bifunctional chorismate mutase/prephenate dehydratase n=1 Tax=Collinsella ureilytica TaxID=2869515 RepID=A0ABS7MLY5_9ACTN|nr:bifunctional chorismate mutase/prephenate dehydratase [Collinsella urealyticum]MBY4798081.1 chorismate mutase [Collinsella urealyticum]
MDLSDIRKRLDEIDTEIIRLACERLDLAEDVARAKAQSGKPIFDPGREREKLACAAQIATTSRAPQAIALMSLLMSMNRAEQAHILAHHDSHATSQLLKRSLLPADTVFPQTGTIACPGTEGSFSQQAACKLFRAPSLVYFDNFQAIFQAVSEGLADFGILPIENSTAGSVREVYDLLDTWGFSIVRSLRLKVSHHLLALPTAKISDIREIISHEQALAQSAAFIQKLGVRTRVVANTALAAEELARSGRTDLGALASRTCADLYGLQILQENVQDSQSNYTRFVVIAPGTQIYPGSTRTSLLLRLQHEPGSLYRVLERFFALDINLVKLESRPIPGTDFTFNFYFDLDCPASSPALERLLDSLSDVSVSYRLLGCYQEMV